MAHPGGTYLGSNWENVYWSWDVLELFIHKRCKTGELCIKSITSILGGNLLGGHGRMGGPRVCPIVDFMDSMNSSPV
eukprot:4807616-Amphidinium_carterae.1